MHRGCYKSLAAEVVAMEADESLSDVERKVVALVRQEGTACDDNAVELVARVSSSPQCVECLRCRRLVTVVAMLQLLERRETTVSSEVFGMFVKIAGFACDGCYSGLMFGLLVESVPPGFVWEREAVEAVGGLLRTESVQGDPDASISLVKFVEMVVGNGNGESITCILNVLRVLIEQRCLVVAGHEVEILAKFTMMEELLWSGDEQAMLFVGSCCQWITSEQMDKYLGVVAKAYCGFASDALDLGDETRSPVHSLPAVCEDAVPEEETEVVEQDDVQEFRRLRPELMASLEDLSKVISQAVMERNELTCRFLGLLTEESRNRFYELMLASLPERGKRSLIVCYEHLLNMMASSNPLSVASNLALLFDASVFDPACTVFGPESIDVITNACRGAVMETIALQLPSLVDDLIRRHQSHCFLLAEISGRVCSYPALMVEVAQRGDIVRILSDTVLRLRYLGANFETRAAILTMFFQIMTGNFRVNGQHVLELNSFVRPVLRFMNEKSLMRPIWEVLGAAMISTQICENDTLSPTVAYLIRFTEQFPQFLGNVLSVVVDAVSFRPELCKSFSSFLCVSIRLMKECPSCTEHVLELLTAVSNSDSSFELSSDDMLTLSQCLTPSHRGIVVNLISGSFSLKSSKKFSLIQRVHFIPLLFVVFLNEMDLALRLLCQWAAGSSYNAKQLHVGAVDLFLLEWLKSDGHVAYKGVNLHFKASKEVVLQLLRAISSVEFNETVTAEFIDVISVMKDSEMIRSLQTVLEVHGQRTCRIGTLPVSAEVIGVTSSLIHGGFTISFLISGSRFVATGPEATAHIISFEDQAGVVLSVSVVNGDLFVIARTKSVRTSALICKVCDLSGWFTFVLHLDGIGRDDGRIVTYVDGSILRTCEFHIPPLADGPIKTRIGGYFTEGNGPVLEIEQARVRRLAVFHRVLTEKESWYLVHSDIFWDSCLFSLYTQHDVCSNGLKVMVNGPDNDGLFGAIGKANNICRLFLTYNETENHIILDILGRVLRHSRDKKAAADAAAVLLGKPRTYKLYQTLFVIVKGIKDVDTQITWFENVLINLDLWGSDDRIISHWNSILLDNFSHAFYRKSYFKYFLHKLTDPSFESLVLLKRVRHSNSSASGDVSAVLSLVSKNVVAYITLLRDIADTMNPAQRDEALVILSFLHSEDIDVVLLILETVPRINNKKFFCLIPSMLKNLKSKEQLVSKLEPYFDTLPSLFALACAIAIECSRCTISKVPRIAVIEPMWYLYPVLFYVKSEEPTRSAIATYLAENSLKATSYLERIVFLAMALTRDSGGAHLCSLLVERLISAVDICNRSQRTVLFWAILTCVLFSIESKENARQASFHASSEHESVDYSSIIRFAEDCLPHLHFVFRPKIHEPCFVSAIKLAVHIAESAGTAELKSSFRSSDVVVYRYSEIARGLRLCFKLSDVVTLEDFEQMNQVMEHVVQHQVTKYLQWANAKTGFRSELRVLADDIPGHF